MKLADDFYQGLGTIKWFSAVGRGTRPTLDFPVRLAGSWDEPGTGFFSDAWADAKVEAQGRLTGYLAGKRYDLFGGHWNNLLRKSRAVLERRAKDGITAGLAAAGLPDELLDAILLDLNLAAIEVAYRKQMPGAPVFFERLLRIYQAGRLPCGWTGNLDEWPVGELVVF